MRVDGVMIRCGHCRHVLPSSALSARTLRHVRAILQPFLEAAALSSRDEASAQPNLDEVIWSLLPACLSMSTLFAKRQSAFSMVPPKQWMRVEAREKSGEGLDAGLAEFSAAGFCTSSVILAR